MSTLSSFYLPLPCCCSDEICWLTPTMVDNTHSHLATNDHKVPMSHVLILYDESTTLFVTSLHVRGVSVSAPARAAPAPAPPFPWTSTAAQRSSPRAPTSAPPPTAGPPSRRRARAPTQCCRSTRRGRRPGRSCGHARGRWRHLLLHLLSRLLGLGHAVRPGQLPHLGSEQRLRHV